jgi:hypothetical protein
MLCKILNLAYTVFSMIDAEARKISIGTSNRVHFGILMIFGDSAAMTEGSLHLPLFGLPPNLLGCSVSMCLAIAVLKLIQFLQRRAVWLPASAQNPSR